MICIDELSFLINTKRSIAQSSQLLQHLTSVIWLAILIHIATFNTFTQFSTFSSRTMTLTIFFQTFTFFTMTSFPHNFLFDNLSCHLFMYFFFFFIMTILTCTYWRITCQTHFQTITITFLTFRMFTITSLSICINNLKRQSFLYEWFFHFHFFNGIR